MNENSEARLVNVIKYIANVFASNINKLKYAVTDLLELSSRLWPDFYIANNVYKHSTVLQTGVTVELCNEYLEYLSKNKDSVTDAIEILRCKDFSNRLSVLYKTDEKISGIIFTAYLPYKKQYTVYKAYELEKTYRNHPIVFYMALTNIFYLGNSPLFAAYTNGKEVTVDLLSLLTLLTILELLHGKTKGTYISLTNRLLSPKLAAIPLMSFTLAYEKNISQRLENSRQDELKQLVRLLTTFAYNETRLISPVSAIIGLMNRHLLLSAFESSYILFNLLENRKFDPVIYALYMLLRPIATSIVYFTDKNKLIDHLSQYETQWQLLYRPTNIDYKVNLETVVQQLDSIRTDIATPKTVLKQVLENFLRTEPDLRASEVITDYDIDSRPYLHKFTNSLTRLTQQYELIEESYKSGRDIVSALPDIVEMTLGRCDSVGVMTYDLGGNYISTNFTLPVKEPYPGETYKAKILFNKLASIKQAENNKPATLFDYLDIEVGLNIRTAAIQKLYYVLSQKAIPKIPVYDIQRLKLLLRTIFARYVCVSNIDKALLTIAQHSKDRFSIDLIQLLQHNLFKKVIDGTVDIAELDREVQLILVWHIIFGLTKAELEALFAKLVSDKEFLYKQYELWKPIIQLVKFAIWQYKKHRSKAKVLLVRDTRCLSDVDLVLKFVWQRLAFIS